MRVLISLGFGLSAMVLAVPALAGSSGHTNAYQANAYQVENGVKVYRAQPATTLSPRQLAYIAQQRRNIAVQAKAVQQQADQARKAEQAYERGFEKGFDAAQKQAKKKTRRRARRNPYNYGRRYVTGYRRPLYYGYR